MKMKVKTCAGCGVQFEQPAQRGRTTDYHSPECKKDAVRKRTRVYVRNFRQREADRKNGVRVSV